MGGEQRVAYAEGEAYGHTVAFRVRQGKLSCRLTVGVLDEAALAGGVVLHPFLAHALAPDGHLTFKNFKINHITVYAPW